MKKTKQAPSRTKISSSTKRHAKRNEYLPAIAAIYAQAQEVFGDRSTATSWLAEPHPSLAQRAPRALLRSELGRQQVRALLNRIEHGLLA